MTRRPGRSVENDPGLAALINVNTAAVCMVGKTWDYHVDVALEIPREENVEMISELSLGRQNAGEVLFDAEHFFDGYKANPQYALSCVKAAYDLGRDGLCFATPTAEHYRMRLIASRESDKCPAITWYSLP